MHNRVWWIVGTLGALKTERKRKGSQVAAKRRAPCRKRVVRASGNNSGSTSGGLLEWARERDAVRLPSQDGDAPLDGHDASDIGHGGVGGVSLMDEKKPECEHGDCTHERREMSVDVFRFHAATVLTPSSHRQRTKAVLGHGGVVGDEI